MQSTHPLLPPKKKRKGKADGAAEAASGVMTLEDTAKQYNLPCHSLCHGIEAGAYINHNLPATLQEQALQWWQHEVQQPVYVHTKDDAIILVSVEWQVSEQGELGNCLCLAATLSLVASLVTCLQEAWCFVHCINFMLVLSSLPQMKWIKDSAHNLFQLILFEEEQTKCILELP